MSSKKSITPVPFIFEQIGVIETDFHDKFGIPRQPGLAKSARGVIKLNHHPFLLQALKGLDSFSHLWIVFVFHQHDSKAWKPSIRPPRLGGAKKVGVLASRSPHRPNPIGLSCVKIEKIDGYDIHVSGVDLLNNTPVLDIKPYVPYADSIPEADGGWAREGITRVPLKYSEQALEMIDKVRQKNPDFPKLVEEVIELDPRPASQRKKFPVDAEHSQGTRFGAQILEWDVRWEIKDRIFYIFEVVVFDGKPPQKRMAPKRQDGPK